MKIGLRAGHSDNCAGAVGIVDEHEQMKKYYAAVKAVLENYGHTVINCNSNANTENGELSEGANIANSSNVDLFASLHMNCFNCQAHGCEVLVSSESSGAYTIAQRLVQNFSELGLYNRGVKFEKLFEMNHISAPNLISEICFCDSQTDIDIYNKYSWEKLAYVLCNAIDTSIPKEPTNANINHDRGFVVSSYLPHDKNYDGVDIAYYLAYFDGVKCYVRGNINGIWIETEYLSIDKCQSLKNKLGNLFYSIEY